MDERKIFLPEIDFAEDDPLYAGVVMATKVFSMMLWEKIDEYGSMDERLSKVLEAFEMHYVCYFSDALKRDVEWERVGKHDPIFKEKLDKGLRRKSNER
jgi:hypothetical protein